MTKQRVIASHGVRERGKRPHKPTPAKAPAVPTAGDVQKTLTYYRGMYLEAVDKMLVCRQSRDRLLTQSLADVCNALADALGMPAEQIDPNRLPEYVKELAQRGKQ